MRRRRVLVTGGAGFIGSHIVDRLIADGHEVVVIDDESTGCRANVHPAAEFIRGDVADPETLDLAFRRKLDAVFHLAAQASISRSFDAPEADLRTNAGGTLCVLQKCLAYRVGRLLYASSMMVYGEPRMVPTPETAPCLPLSCYGISKYAAERYVIATAKRRDLGFGLAVTAFRMFNVYGERQSLANPYQGVVAIFIGNVTRGEPITIHGDGAQSRDFVYVGDVVEAWMGALDRPEAVGQVFNLGSGVERPISEVADAVLSALGTSRQRYAVVHVAARAGDVRRMAADITRARTVLGWEPRVTFGDGLAETVRWAVTPGPRGRAAEGVR